ncbi:uracil-xanthine permease family protein [Streptomyces chattanoogensis]|uniref:Permease n=1 Tax=Streptomyces chattanoogensis TaxID=66876 RepID=A0A0N1JX68_9ACTN|nr:solute carrier family 23 protein [Streptomyces chattanoogensis]KPC61467.1 permease [Streptomyces chattanoogensis]
MTPPVDERLPLLRLLPYAAQHVLAMIAAPVSSVFLIAAGLRLSPGRTASLLSATLVLCGAGALLQSFGVLRTGARLPFMMLPGGAAVAIFLEIAHTHGAATASGSVLLAAALLLAVLPLYGRLVRFFPPLVMGATVLVIGINMIRVAAPMAVAGRGTALVTIAATTLGLLVLRGAWRRLSVLIGMAVGTVTAALTGSVFPAVPGDAVLSLPQPLPYGAPQFDLLAALPLMVFALASLAEATGQTVLNSEAVGRTPDPARDVPRTARADAVLSLGAGLFGGPVMVTSAENIGIVQLTGVRSRFVTAGAGALLVLAGLLAPVTRLLAALPAPVVGGAALVIYAVIAAMGIDILRRSDLTGRTEGTDGTGGTGGTGPTGRAATTVVALTLLAGLLPMLAPQLYAPLPGWARTLFGSGVPAAALTAIVLSALFARCAPRAERQSREARPHVP